MINNFSNLKVCILCGGKGERLQPLTKNLPKPLIKINKKEILSHIVDHLKSNGLKNFLISTGFKHDLINKFFQKKYSNLNIKIIKTGVNKDIIERVKSILKFVSGDLLICYGDTLTNINIRKLYNFHQRKKFPATISCYQLKTQFGILDINKKNLITSFKEKPNLGIWYNIGYILLSNKTLKKLNKFNKFQNFLEHLAKNKLAGSFRHKGLHITVNTVKELDEAKKTLAKFEKKKYEKFLE